MENLIKELGIEKYKKSIEYNFNKGKASDTDVIKMLERKIIKKVTESISDNLCELNSKKFGKSLVDLQNLNEIEPEKIAFVGISYTLDVLLRKEIKYNTLCCEIGKALNDEIIFNRLKKEHPEQFKLMQENTEKSRSFSYVSKVFKYRANRYMMEDFSQSTKAKFGAFVINHIQNTVGLIDTYKEKKGKGFVRICRLHDKYEDYIEKLIELRSSLSYSFLPITEKPKPWTSINQGGYHTIENLTFVKSTNKSILNQNCKEYFTAINKLQETGYQINERVLDVMNSVKHDSIHFYRGENFDNINRESILNITEEKYQEIRKEQLKNKLMRNETLYKQNVKTQKQFWKLFFSDSKDELFEGCNELLERMFALKKYDIALRRYKHSKALLFERQRVKKITMYKELSLLRDAEMYLNKTFYFPCAVDFRGRVYTIPTRLSFQGGDKEKGLLLFEKAKPITEQGVAWYMIHGANVFGIDKENYHERIAFIKHNEQNILNVSEDPIQYRDFWEQAEDPFQFLAFCFEYADFIKSGFNPNFESKLMCYYDATNNALQHYSSILLERKTALLTNVIDSDNVQDIYSVIANKVKLIVDSDLNHSIAELWRKYGIDRKLAKKPVMTYLYGSNQYGFGEQIFKEINQEISDIILFKDKNREAANYIASLFIKVIEKELKAGYMVRNKLREMVRAVLDNGYNSIEYYTPAGFKVVVDYRIFERKEISINLNKKRLKINIKKSNTKPDRKKTVNAIAANFIHSLDASHLIKTVNSFCNDIAVVHDCFAVHACNAQQIHNTARREFFEIHVDNQMNKLIEQINDRYNCNIEYIERLNQFDIEEVLKSKYFLT